jgi:hypothetical protein
MLPLRTLGYMGEADAPEREGGEAMIAEKEFRAWAEQHLAADGYFLRATDNVVAGVRHGFLLGVATLAKAEMNGENIHDVARKLVIEIWAQHPSLAKETLLFTKESEKDPEP